ncbi:hypothetical protein MICAC_2680009 [Microcystis aeruginosa PCC 9443]|uniref:Uncharacterized protein n=1 Tax=Microcystis aeruginosa PCC 9443 TaxID=1160281 RepID=I4G1P4_MICAE|nr:hypothetical protein MICAC_2680009 [Microcystis aeruginosa PCC 9443]
MSIYSYHSRRLNVLEIMNLNEHLVSFSQKVYKKSIYPRKESGLSRSNYNKISFGLNGTFSFHQSSWYFLL